MTFSHRRHVAHDHSLFARSVVTGRFPPSTPLKNSPYRRTPALHARADCEPADPLNTLTDRLNTLLNSSGPGYILPLCPSTQYFIQAPIFFFAPDQEISTVGYPQGDERASLVVSGPVSQGQGHTTAVDGTCANCGGVKLRNIQVRARLAPCFSQS